MRNALGITFATLLTLASPAFAQDEPIVPACLEHNFKNLDKNLDSVTLQARQQQCINEQREKLSTLHVQNKLLNEARGVFAKIWRNPVAVLDYINFEQLREKKTASGKLGYVFQNARVLIDPIGKEGRDPYAEFRSIYADPAYLKMQYAKYGSALADKIRFVAIIGFVQDPVREAYVVFAKPFDPAIALGAARWYLNECWQPFESMHDSDKEYCKEVTWFAERFTAHYGVEPNKSAAVALSYLLRRYAEGGKALVAAWQEISLDFAKKIDAIPAELAPKAEPVAAPETKPQAEPQKAAPKPGKKKG